MGSHSPLSPPFGLWFGWQWASWRSCRAVALAVLTEEFLRRSGRVAVRADVDYAQLVTLTEAGDGECWYGAARASGITQQTVTREPGPV